MKKIYISIVLAAGAISCLSAMNHPQSKQDTKSPLERGDELTGGLQGLPDELLQQYFMHQHKKTNNPPKSPTKSWDDTWMLESEQKQSDTSQQVLSCVPTTTEKK